MKLSLGRPIGQENEDVKDPRTPTKIIDQALRSRRNAYHK